jgi:large subunit ribosomal protein L23
MKPADVLIRPVITEKVNAQMETSGRYTFVVDKRSNKLEIKKAIEEFYNVKVVDIHTMVVP